MPTRKPSLCLCTSRNKPNPQCPLAAHRASARAKLQDSKRKRAKPVGSSHPHARCNLVPAPRPLASAMHPDNVEGVRNASVANAHAAAERSLEDLNKPKPRAILSEGMKLGTPVDATEAQCGHEWAGVAGEKLEPRTFGNHRCTLLASICTAGQHLCNCGATKTTLAPTPAAYGHQRMQVEEAATSQLQGGDKDARDGWAKDLGDAGIPPFVELDAAGREDMALECERMAAQLRHVEAGQRMWAAHKYNAPTVWTGIKDGCVTRTFGPVVEVSISLVVASTFKVGP